MRMTTSVRLSRTVAGCKQRLSVGSEAPDDITQMLTPKAVVSFSS